MDTMTPLMPELEVELVKAAGRANRPNRVSLHANGCGLRLWRSGRRGSAVVLVGLAISATALAATEPWQPLLGNDHAGHPSTSSAPPPDEQVAALAVLRRPPTAVDHGPDVLGSLRAIGPQSHGIRLSYVRQLRSVAGGAVLLISTQRFGDDAAGAHHKVGGSPLCVYYPFPSGAGGAYKCWHLTDIRSGAAVGLSSGAGGHHVYGLVPDGVSTVTLRLPGLPPVTVDVRDNFFDVVLDARGLAAAFSGGNVVRQSIAWLDVDGMSAGPPARP